MQALVSCLVGGEAGRVPGNRESAARAGRDHGESGADWSVAGYLSFGQSVPEPSAHWMNEAGIRLKAPIVGL